MAVSAPHHHSPHQREHIMSRIALITGASKGLGRETAQRLSEQGCTVIVAARNEAHATEVASSLANPHLPHRGVKLDVTDSSDIASVRDLIEKEYGRLDILVNNAGIQIDCPGFMPGNNSAGIDADVLHRTFETNFFAPILLTQTLLPLLEKSDAGRIVNVSSIMGSLTLHADASSPIYGIKLLAYNSSKTALNQYTVHLAEALKNTSVKVNSAHPGWVKTALGGEYAPMSVAEGVTTILDLCAADESVPSGAFIHLGQPLPW
jgi:NAD(P)-dependent dehydrogenase (short-subunit alcohol dehydrogenase family)